MLAFSARELLRKDIIIGGGYALIIYRLYLAEENIGVWPIGTRDIDSLIPRKFSHISKKTLAEHLKDHGFKQIFKDYENPATESYLKDFYGTEMELEFLTDNLARKDKKDKNVSINGIVAQPLRYIELSFENTTEFKTNSGESGLVVSHEAWLFHKGF